MFFLQKDACEKKKTLDKRKVLWYYIYVVGKRHIKWEFSSAGRASALQAEGQRFEPVNSHHESTS